LIRSPSSQSHRPRFSVLIPTRDRPAYVRNALESVVNQSFADFEVIISDNFKDHSCKGVVEEFADPRVRYITPAEPLAMHDNWEFAIDQARGDFVLVLIDKTLLRVSALERLQAATLSHPAELYSWTSDAYYLTDETQGDVGRGYIVPVRGTGEPFYVDCEDEIAASISFRRRLGTEGAAYAYGKICFGAYSRELIARIKSRFGRVCALISPDYTSKTVAVLATDRLVDLNGSYTVHLITSISNGMLFAQDSTHALRFLAQAGKGKAEFATFPIPHVYCSVHNLCAYDWRMLGADYVETKLDLAALYVQVERDLDAVKSWASEAEKQAMLGHMRDFFEASPAAQKNRILDEKRRVYEEISAARETLLVNRETSVKGREDYVQYREDYVQHRENYVQHRENYVQHREQAVAAREAWLAPPLRALKQLQRVKRALFEYKRPSEGAPASAVPKPVLSSEAQPIPKGDAWPMQNGYPVFGLTLEMLRYAESPRYVYPMPQTPEAGPA
jgi:hypothetical protein